MMTRSGSTAHAANFARIGIIFMFPLTPRVERGSRELRRSLLLCCVLLRFRFGRCALLLRQLQKALPFAGILALAAIVRSLASGLSLAGVHAIALNLRLGGTSRADRYDVEQNCGHRSEGDTRFVDGHLHTRLSFV